MEEKAKKMEKTERAERTERTEKTEKMEKTDKSEKALLEKELDKDTYLISEASKLVEVESHVLRYWEEELKLPIRRNELGHRYYTKEDVQQFREIKKLKEQGLQLKAIRTVLSEDRMQIIVPPQAMSFQENEGQIEKQDKSIRLQALLHELISQAVRENNRQLVEEVKETMLKELDYQFRLQEEQVEAREGERVKREEEHYKKLDELLRQYSGKKRGFFRKKGKVK